ncbi:MAG: zf-TFIIB domain-containing protein [Candidatus Binatia bacterium]
MPAELIPCPHCAVTMAQVTAHARSGYGLLLDQCPRCGGIWCDRWELYPLDRGEAARLDPVDEERLHAPPTSPAEPGRCPRCTSPLHPFRDPALPPGARIERCPVCDGMWLNRGELSRFKEHDAGGRPDPLPQLTGALAHNATWAQVSNLDAATYAADEPPDDDQDSWLAWLRSAAPWLAVATLLRILLR